MLSFRTALICLVVAIVLAIVSHPRVFFGDGPSSLISFDGLFFVGQWGALLLSLAALLLSWMAWRHLPDATRTLNAAWLPALSAVMVTYLFLTGVPHEANHSEWRRGELGVAAYFRGLAKQKKANAKPIILKAETFAGNWRAVDGALYTFSSDRVNWTAATGNGELSASACGAGFAIRYVQQGRDMLQDLGLSWSEHAFAAYQAADTNVVISVAEIACGSDRFVFIRASQTEVWRWNNSLDANGIKNESFVMHRVDP